MSNVVSLMCLGLFVYLHIYHGYSRLILSHLSRKLFGVAKPVLAFIFTQVCVIIVQRLFVPVTIAILAVSTVGELSVCCDTLTGVSTNTNRPPPA